MKTSILKTMMKDIFLTPWGCLCCAFADFSLKPPEISEKMADALMDDFFEIMEAAGILEKKNKS